MPSTKNGDWTHYTADMRGTKYSPLDQINGGNFNQLEVAWRFKTDNLGTRPEFKLEGTPLAIKGVLYTTAGTRRSVVALDGRTGELIWTHSYREGNRAAIAPRQLSGRGVSYWTDGKGDDRILYVTTGYRLIALNAKNGAMVASFGEGGIVDLKKGAVTGKGQQIELETGEIGLHSTPTIVGNVVLIGSSFKEGMTVATHNNTKGLVRAFDVKTGKLLWTFNTIPRPGEFGNDTWENESWAINGNTGVWTQITVDEEAGLVYLPVEDPTSDYYGGHRPGNNLFGDSIVCVDLKTGQRKWHFQIVHHPIWDYDMSSAPILLDANVNGKPIKAVAVPSKQSYLYVFDRITGAADLADRRAAGAAVRRAEGEDVADAAVPDQAAGLRPSVAEGAGRSDRLHAGDARAGAREPQELPRGGDVQPAAARQDDRRPARRDQRRQRERRHQLAGRGRRSRNAHRLRAGGDGVRQRPVAARDAVDLLVGHEIRLGRRRHRIPRSARSGLRQRGGLAARGGARTRGRGAGAGRRCRGGGRPRRPWTRRGGGAGRGRCGGAAGGRRRAAGRGPADRQAAVRRARGDRSRQGRAEVPGAARRHAGRRPQPIRRCRA